MSPESGGTPTCHAPRVSTESAEKTEQFEYEVAEALALPQHGIGAIGWIRVGTVRIGDQVAVDDDAAEPYTVRGVGILDGLGPKAGSANIELLLDDYGTKRLAPGVPIRRWRDFT